MPKKLSFHNTPIEIHDRWRADEAYEGMFPTGAREKDTYFSPENPQEECIQPNWRYLFKLSRNIYPWQFWSEIIAYRFGCVIGVKVPPTHIGLSKSYEDGVDTYAALIEWFYDDRENDYIPGGQLMTQRIEGFDRDKGKQHNFKTIWEIFPHDVWLSYWAKVLTFDSLIGNTDRHQDNWGLISDIAVNKKTTTIDLNTSPAFDNVTDLCNELREEHFHKFDNASRMNSYLTGKHAKHHMKWSLKDPSRYNFHTFMAKFMVAFPQSKPIIARCLNFS